MRPRLVASGFAVVFAGALGIGAVLGGGATDPLGRSGPEAKPPTPRLHAPCGTCPDPSVFVFEIDFVGSELWELGTEGTLFRMSGCTRLETIAIQGFRGLASGLAYDSYRGLLVVADLGLDAVRGDEEVWIVDLEGNLVRTFPAPTENMIGAAYDSKRDLYWFTDLQTREIVSMDPDSGERGASFPAPAGSRIAGAAYEPGMDAIVYNGRNEARTYFASIETGEQIAYLDIPSSGFNNGEGVGIAPDKGVWVHHFEAQSAVCTGKVQDATADRPLSWGRLKAMYR